METYNCRRCGRRFRSKTVATYCSTRCHGISRSSGVDPAQLRQLYESGLSQREIADQLGVGKSTVHRLMQQYDVTPRPAIKRDQRGEKNAGWKGDAASYNALHGRVIAKLGRACRCETCGSTEEGKRYDWANLTGDYANIGDYRSMCRSCHLRYDNARRRELGADVMMGRRRFDERRGS